MEIYTLIKILIISNFISFGIGYWIKHFFQKRNRKAHEHNQSMETFRKIFNELRFFLDESKDINPAPSLTKHKISKLEPDIKKTLYDLEPHLSKRKFRKFEKAYRKFCFPNEREKYVYPDHDYIATTSEQETHVRQKARKNLKVILKLAKLK